MPHRNEPTTLAREGMFQRETLTANTAVGKFSGLPTVAKTQRVVKLSPSKVKAIIIVIVIVIVIIIIIIIY